MNPSPQNFLLLGGTIVFLVLAVLRLPAGGIRRFRLIAGPVLGCVVAVVLAFLIEASARELLHPKQTVADLLIFATIISATEEALRANVFLVVRRRASRVVDPREWITQGIILGLVFSLFENTLFAGGQLLDWHGALLRLCLTTPGHCAYAGLIALGAVRRNFQGKSSGAIECLLAAILLHAAFDFAGFTTENLRPPPNEILIRALQAIAIYGTLRFIWLKTRQLSANSRSSQRLGEPIVLEA